MTRRWLLRSGMVGVTGLFGLLWRSGGAPAPGASPAMGHQSTVVSIEDSVVGLFSDLQAARDVGFRYLAHCPAEADPGLLRRALFDVADERFAHNRDPHALGSALGQRRRRDFMAGRTVIVDGWVLAKSEARLCALLALSRTG